MRQAAKRWRRDIDRELGKPGVEVDADTTKAKREIERLEKDKHTAHIKVEVDQASLARASRTIGSASRGGARGGLGGLGSALGGVAKLEAAVAGISLAPNIVPAIGSVVSAVGQLSGVLGLLPAVAGPRNVRVIHPYSDC